MLPIKIEQIAFVTDRPDTMKLILNDRFGLSIWNEDEVVARGFVWGQGPVVNRAKLYFNHEMGIEYEILHYVDGDNWHRFKRDHDTYFSHLGTHVDDIEKAVEHFSRHYALAQRVETVAHANGHLRSIKRRYHYAVFDSRMQLGFDLKLIQRIQD